MGKKMSEINNIYHLSAIFCKSDSEEDCKTEIPFPKSLKISI